MTEELATGKRVDARRNRAKILDVAREALAETGDLPSMAEISRRAGVGMATLYRNFPGRPELVEELYRSQVDDICASATAAGGDTAGEALFSWLGRFHAAGARKGPLAMLLLEDSGGDSAVLNESRARVVAAAQPLFDAAAKSGQVRDDVSLGQVLDAVVALERVREDPSSKTSMVQVLFDGLRR
ncbi:transcriptional regulator, TetR family [Lentzea fradiae]|uniref:Transcriptional regulator, TetR family n=1 Tax=Lentzea fradiae TaxID=200378 RepID=A0A1G7L1Y8_9PSEU|nr:TetR/AcrR family transcriptional regulator [Lentzea fradiae]SDF43527.1 transcriptional regulator, TetR family [Lentzea fradiae]